MGFHNFWLLHTIDDLKLSLKLGLKQSDIIYSTNSSIKVYLDEQHNINSDMISSLLISDEIEAITLKSFEELENELKKLDIKYSSIISKNINISENIEYFRSQYLHLYRYKYSGLIAILRGLEKAFNKYTELKNIYIFKSSVQPNFERFIKQKSTVLSTIENRNMNISVKDKLKDFLRPLLYVYKSLKLYRNLIIDDNLSTIIYWGGMYDLTPVIPHLKKHNQIVYSHTDSYFPLFHWRLYTKKIKIIESNTVKFPIDLILNDIKKDFNSKIGKQLTALEIIANKIKKHKVDFAIWANPPAFGIKALVFNYLRKKKIKIIGYQHGASYGYDDYYGQHITTDYENSDYFISYGFIKQDLKKHYKNISESKLTTIDKVSILPIGRYSIQISDNNFINQLNILYPLNNNLDIFSYGLFRGSPETLTETQRNIIHTIDCYQQTLIKPFVNYNYMNCSVIPLLENLKKAKVNHKLQFKYYLQNFKINIVIIDAIHSTTLNETLALTDIPVILYLNKEDEKYVSKDALTRLKEEVFVVYSKEALKIIIDKILNKEIQNKPRGAFSQKYAKPETVENITNKLNKLMGL